MKFVIVIISWLFFTPQSSPLGVWLYKEDGSKIEIWESEGKLFATVIATGNPSTKAGTQILKDFEILDGQWKGKYHIIKKKRWVDATLEPKGNLLHIELEFDFTHKKFHWYKQKI